MFSYFSWSYSSLSCVPFFHKIAADNLEYCRGENLACLKSKLSVMTDDIYEAAKATIDSPTTNDIAKPLLTTCLPTCLIQENESQLSYFSYPQKSSFVHRRAFCETSSHILQRICNVEAKKYFLDSSHPKLCNLLGNSRKYFEEGSTCENWPNEFFLSINGTYNPNHDELIDAVHDYATKNLARVKIMIRNPYVTIIKRDLSMTFTSYVANTGGLLGLCIGCSFISFMEILYHCIFKLLYKQ